MNVHEQERGPRAPVPRRDREGPGGECGGVECGVTSFIGSRHNCRRLVLNICSELRSYLDALNFFSCASDEWNMYALSTYIYCARPFEYREPRDIFYNLCKIPIAVPYITTWGTWA